MQLAGLDFENKYLLPSSVGKYIHALLLIQGEPVTGSLLTNNATAILHSDKIDMKKMT